MKKILIFLHVGYDAGGGTQSFLELLPMLTSEYNVFIAAPDLQEKYKEKCILQGVDKNNFCSFLPAYSWCDSIKKQYSIKNIVKRLIYHTTVKKQIHAIHEFFNCNFDLIYSNTLAVQLGCEYAMYYNIPHLWHVREFMREDHKLEFLMRKRIYKKLFPYSNAIFITNAISDKFKQYFKEKTTVIHNFVKFKYIEKVPHNNFVFAIVGHISESKGQRYAIEAFNMLLNQYSDCKLLIVGQGGDSDYCKRLVNKNSLGDKVEFLGQRNDVDQILSNTNVLLVCSRSEAMGRVTVEGMLSKTLVIGADTAGTKELIGNCYGLLYKQGSTYDLYKKMLYSIEHKVECENIIDGAYRFATEEFSYSKYENKLIRFFDNVLDR